jgi:Subtilase family
VFERSDRGGTARAWRPFAVACCALCLIVPAATARPAVSGAARPATRARASAACSARQRARRVKALRRFRAHRAADRRKYFRHHRRAAARKAFVRRQNARLKHLKRAVALCEPRPKPKPLAAPPAPQPGAPADGGSLGSDAVPVGPLSGPPGAPAVGALGNTFAADAPLAPGETSISEGARVARTELQLELAPGATVGAVNDLLRRLDARIVSSLANVALPTVRIPDPGSIGALRALVARLAGEPALRRADVVAMPVSDALPFELGTGVADVVPQLAERASAAWNARAALAGAAEPTLLIGDAFGGGPPGDLFGVSPTTSDFETGAGLEHGYLVLGLAAAAFDPVGGNLTADRATGVFPGEAMPMRAVDLQFGLGDSVFRDQLVDRIRTTSGRLVLNTSLSSRCAVRAPNGCTLAEVTEEGRQWAARVNGQHVAGKFVQTTSAGNINPAVPGATDAHLNSDWNAAALPNTVVVENAIAAPPGADAPRPRCLNATSLRGGQVSAVGTGVTSLQSPTLGVFEADGGTSSAAPQVAGLAAYLWSLDPGLSPAQVVGDLRATAAPVASPGAGGGCQAAAPAPVIDAYAAVLAADRPGHTPARSALLDVADATGQEGANQHFDEHDLAALTNAFDTANGALDYGRFDLNGDGHTGGATTSRFDLTIDHPAAWTTNATQTIRTLPVRFDETQLTDLQIACFYANSSLYTGDPTVRDQFDEERCLPQLDLGATFPATVTAGADAPLTLHLTRPDFPGGPVDQPGARLELSVVGGSIDDVTGLTGSGGEFATDARLLAPATTLTIHVVARAGPGGPVLAQKQVQASSTTAPHIELVERTGGASATGLAQARSDDGEITFQETENSPHAAADFSPISGSAAVAGSASGTGGFTGDKATVNSSGDIDLSIDTTSPAALGVHAAGSCSAAAMSVFHINSSDVTAIATGGAGFRVRFKVVGGPMTYSLSITGAADLEPFGQPDSPFAVGSGTLPVGEYLAAGGANCSVGGNDSAGDSGSLELSVNP